MNGTEWMGRYRELIQLLVQHTNQGISTASMKLEVTHGIFLSQQEWQVLEYTIEHEQDDVNMKYISDQLRIPKSTFSKHTKRLGQMGLINRYQAANNKKNIILKPSDAGKECYYAAIEEHTAAFYAPFFQELAALSDEGLHCVTRALQYYNQLLGRIFPQDYSLIPLDEERAAK